MEHKMCVLIFSTTFSETLLIQRKTEREIIRNVQWSSCQAPAIIAIFEWSFTFLDWFSTNTQIPNLMKILSLEAKLFRANSRFSKFAKKPNNMVTSQNILLLHLTDCWHLHDI